MHSLQESYWSIEFILKHLPACLAENNYDRRSGDPDLRYWSKSDISRTTYFAPRNNISFHTIIFYGKLNPPTSYRMYAANQIIMPVKWCNWRHDFLY